MTEAFLINYIPGKTGKLNSITSNGGFPGHRGDGYIRVRRETTLVKNDPEKTKDSSSNLLRLVRNNLKYVNTNRLLLGIQILI